METYSGRRMALVRQKFMKNKSKTPGKAGRNKPSWNNATETGDPWDNGAPRLKRTPRRKTHLNRCNKYPNHLTIHWVVQTKHFLESPKYKNRNWFQRSKIGGRISSKLLGTYGNKKHWISTSSGTTPYEIWNTGMWSQLWKILNKNRIGGVS